MFDGDTIFCMATGAHSLNDSEGFFSVPMAETMNELGRAAADCMARAIVKAVIYAHSMGKISAFRDLQPL
jgi:putative pantetheine hydrolase